MAESFVLSIDQGTTSSRVILFDHSGSIRGQAQMEFKQHYPQPGWVEHDATEIWNVTLRVVQDAMKNAKVTADQINAIGITNQRETTVLWDRKTGKPVANAIVWQDRRTAGICDTLRNQGLADTIRDKTGLVIDAYFSGTKVKWMLDNIPGLRDRANRGEIAFGTIDSWLVWNLTGGKVHITDYSNASRTLMYNIHTLEWDAELLKILDVPAEILPKVRPSSTVYGQTEASILGGKSVPVSGIAGDQQAALFGQACYSKGLAKNTYGTGSFMLMNTGPNAVASKSNLLTTIAWGVGDEPVQYALEGAIFITGAAVQWLRDGLQIVSTAAETEQLARSIPSNEGVYFVPALVGLGAPYWDSYARGTIIGITRGTTRAHFARAALEAMCYQTRDVLEAMERDSGIQLAELRADGGAAGNAFLMQFQADMLGVPVEVPKVSETTALGAAYLAGIATGFWSGQKEIESNWQVANRYKPQVADVERNGLFDRWHEAVERSREWEKKATAAEQGAPSKKAAGV
jgi:glycerol kinase